MKFGFPDQGGKSSFAIPLCTMVSIRSFSPTTPHIARFLAARHAVRTSIAPVTEDHRRLGERGVTHLKGSHVSQKVFCAVAQNSLLNLAATSRAYATITEIAAPKTYRLRRRPAIP